MFRLMIGLALSGFLMLLIATASLAWLNWSEKLWMPIISALLVGTTTAFVTIVASLKPTSVEDTFLTGIVINKNTGGLAHVFNQSPRDVNTYLRHIGLVYILGGYPAKVPPEPSNEGVFLLSVLQIYLIQCLGEPTSGSVAGTIWNDTLHADYKPPAPISDLVEYPVGERLRSLALHRIGPIRDQPVQWNDLKLRLPPGTRLEFINENVADLPAKAGVRIVKPSYFTIDILFHQERTYQGVPTDIMLVDDLDPSHMHTVLARVSFKASFDRITAGSERAQDYKEWSEWLRTRVRERFVLPGAA